VPCYEQGGTIFNSYTNRERHNAQRHRQTARQLGDTLMPVADLILPAAL